MSKQMIFNKKNKPLLLASLAFTFSFSLYTPVYANNNCSGVEVQAHRGHYTQPENSSAAIKSALNKGFDGVEIDIMQLKDGNWVVHHDLNLGRTLTGSKHTLIRRINSSKYKRLKHKSRKGSVTSLPATTLEKALNTFVKHSNNSQQLNIEIKDISSCSSIRNMADEVSLKLKDDSYQFTSINRTALQCLRDSGYKGYIGLVISPDSKKITDDVKSKYSKYKSFANKYIKKYDLSNTIKKSYDEVGNYSVLNKSGMSKLKRDLGSRVGIHIDIETLIKKKSIIRLAKSKKIKLVTYSLNGDKAHARGLSKIYKRSKWKPHAIIIDKKISNVCNIY